MYSKEEYKRFKEYFLNNIEGHLKSPKDANPEAKKNNPYSVIEQSKISPDGMFSRILDEFKIPVPTYEDFKRYVEAPNCIGAYMQSLLEGVLPTVLNEDKTALNPRLIAAINHNDKENYNKLVEKAGGNPTKIANLFLQAIIIGYDQQMLESLNENDKLKWYDNEAIEFTFLANNVTLNGLSESAKKPITIEKTQLKNNIGNLKNLFNGKRPVTNKLDEAELYLEMPCSILKAFGAYERAIERILLDFNEFTHDEVQGLYKTFKEDIYLTQYAGQKIKDLISFAAAYAELSEQNIKDLISFAAAYAELSDTESNDNSAPEVKQAVRNLLSSVKKIQVEGNLSITDLPRITTYLKDTNTLIRNPLNNEAYQKHNNNIKDAIGKNRSWGPIIGGALLGIAGALLVAAAITVTVLTFGVSSPLTLPTAAVGGALTAAGIAMTLGAATGLAVTAVIGTEIAVETGKFAYNAAKGPIATAMEDVSSSIGQERKAKQHSLRKNKNLSRVGTMFGETQFCYAEKPGGVEPGFRAIDLDESFFQELEKKILNAKDLPEKFEGLKELFKDDLQHKRESFSKFINDHTPEPHNKDEIDSDIAWLCTKVKEAVDHNRKLNAWMYKLDYAEGQKDRVKVNKEAIREFIGTRLASIFSKQNQIQEIACANGKKGAHIILACGWKNGLQMLKDYLHGGSGPDYNGILVEDKNAKIKESKSIPGLGKNLIFGIAIGDRDGIGKEAQNKGVADDKFYGFDYGKPYEGEGVCLSLREDFSFEDSFAKAPALFRYPTPIGLARHFMYRNYSIFFDTPLSERMEGFHLLRKMITGENPSEQVIKSYPGLRKGLRHIDKSTPDPEKLIKELKILKSNYGEGSPFQALVDKQITQIEQRETHFDLYFAEIKKDLIDMALKNDIPYKELDEYMGFIDEMARVALNSNQHILDVFEQRGLLTCQQIDLIDNLEKYFSPTSVMSSDGTVFLNTMRFDPESGRIPFQLKPEEDGTYTLSTTNIKIVDQLKTDFNLNIIKSDTGLSCNLNQNEVKRLMDITEGEYKKKREDLLIKPTYKLITLPKMSAFLNQGSVSDQKAEFGFLWGEDGRLSLRIVAKTEEQVQQAKEIIDNLPFERNGAIVPKVNEAIFVEIPSENHKQFQEYIEKHPSLEQRQSKFIQFKESFKEAKQEHENPESTSNSLIF